MLVSLTLDSPCATFTPVATASDDCGREGDAETVTGTGSAGVSSVTWGSDLLLSRVGVVCVAEDVNSGVIVISEISLLWRWGR